MKILLDECLPFDFRHSFPRHEAHTAQWAGLKGLENGDLLRAAEAVGYEVLLTVDKGIIYQQNLAGRQLAIIVMRVGTRMQELLPLVDAVLEALETIRQGAVVTLP